MTDNLRSIGDKTGLAIHKGVKEVLQDAINAIDSGELNPSFAILCFYEDLSRNDSRTSYYCASGSYFEHITLLEKVKHSMLHDWNGN